MVSGVTGANTVLLTGVSTYPPTHDITKTATSSMATAPVTSHT